MCLRNLRPRLPSSSALDPLTPVFATHPRNHPVSPFVATLPKTASRKSFVCHTCATPSPTRVPSARGLPRVEARAFVFFLVSPSLFTHPFTSTSKGYTPLGVIAPHQFIRVTSLPWGQSKGNESRGRASHWLSAFVPKAKRRTAKRRTANRQRLSRVVL